ncbi:MAG: inositol monophosphatase [Treponema sp.]|nr:inositol monophosphatase [Treponema sp.]
MDLGVLLPKVKQAALDSWGRLKNGADLEVQVKGPHDFVTRVDLEISEYLCSVLPALLDDSQVVSEERKDAASSLPYRWIIDPIDGTNNLIYGLPFYAVSIGLVHEMQSLLGVVYLPGTGELFSAARNHGALAENLPAKTVRAVRVNSAAALDVSIVMAETDPYFDRKKNPSMDLIRAVFQKCLDLRITGSAAIDMSYIASGRAMVHFCRHLSPWDYAGGAAILMEAGGLVSQWDGTPMPYEGRHTSLASSSGAIHEAMLEILGRFL